VKDLCREFSSVYPYKTEEETFQSVLSICNKTADNESSMLKDMKAGRPTEIDAIVGVVLKEAEKKDRCVPFFHLLYNMVKGKENKLGLMPK
jgi:2-dehydropantoate 2-reductase